MANKKTNDMLGRMAVAGAFILIGVLFCIFRSGITSVILTVIGVLFILAGLAQILVDRNIVAGVLGILCGLVIILGWWLFPNIALILFGAMLILKGIADLCQSGRRAPEIVSAILTIAAGVLFIVFRVAALDWLYIVIGACFIVFGVLTFFTKRRIVK